MPLSQAAARSLLTRRTFQCEGFARDDGLLDVEGRITDVHSQDSSNDWRGTVMAGQPVHDMWVRMTFDRELTIRAIELSMDSAPYPYCPEVIPNLQRLIGLRIIGGFKKELHIRAGGTDGCTHIVALIENLATVAVRALARRTGQRQGRREALTTFGESAPDRPALIGTCHSYAAQSPVVQRLWPQHYVEPSLDQGAAPGLLTED